MESVGDGLLQLLSMPVFLTATALSKVSWLLAQLDCNHCIACLQSFSWTEPNLLAAGIYNSVHAFFPGCTVNNVTYLPTDSRLAPGYQSDAYLQIQPVQAFSSCL